MRVDGRFYKAIQTSYSCSVARVEINDMITDWFDTSFGKENKVIIKQIISFGLVALEYVRTYKYLGFSLDGFMTFEV